MLDGDQLAELALRISELTESDTVHLVLVGPAGAEFLDTAEPTFQQRLERATLSGAAALGFIAFKYEGGQLFGGRYCLPEVEDDPDSGEAFEKITDDAFDMVGAEAGVWERVQ
jgi:hypothetical protein